jgi:hypothetical protein
VSPGAELFRLVNDGDRVIVDDAKNRIVLVLQPSPILDRAEVVPDVELPGRLNPTENP